MTRIDGKFPICCSANCFLCRKQGIHLWIWWRSKLLPFGIQKRILIFVSISWIPACKRRMCVSETNNSVILSLGGNIVWCFDSNGIFDSLIRPPTRRRPLLSRNGFNDLNCDFVDTVVPRFKESISLPYALNWARRRELRLPSLRKWLLQLNVCFYF